ncbi:hypothetical protein N9Y42_10475, partial [Mariniblastus sp.]|nr:hypothetical protein [Mariniblastus sp.]
MISPLRFLLSSMICIALFVSNLTCCHQANGQTISTPRVADQIDWRAMLAEHDMVWNTFPKEWYEGPFLGNGEQGTLLRQLNKRTLRWDVGCSAAHDHRPVDKDDLSEKHVEVLNRGRLFIGHLELKTPKTLVTCGARLSLWDAEANGMFTSGNYGGTLKWKTFVPLPNRDKRL